MPLVLNEEQQILKDTAREFIAEHSPVTAFRKLRDENDAAGFDREVWAKMSELGWPGILIDEDHGGVDFGFQGMGAVLEECGKTLTASPLISTALIGASLISRLGSSAQKTEWLPAIASGKLITALALEESPHHQPFRIETSAHDDAGELVVSGEKTFILDGHVADLLLVVARIQGERDDPQGLRIVAIPAGTAGVNLTRTSMVDNRNAANVQLTDVRVPATAVLGGTGVEATGALSEVLDLARIGLAAEMLGGTCAVFEKTMEYLKTREQFGALIGTFQGLKHRAAEMFSEIELAKSAVIAALDAVERNENVPMMASLAKAQLSKTFHRVSAEGVQMHGGIGMTDDEDVGLYLKRCRVAEQTFGDSKYHRKRYASLAGF